MGSVYAGLLADGVNEVHVVDIRQDHIDAIARAGLRVSGASGDRVVTSIGACTSTRGIGICDLVIIATKASGVEAAARSARELIASNTLILTIQNGLGAAERIQSAIDSDHILLGVAEGFGASMVGPGHVHHNGMALIRLGEMRGGWSERLEAVAAVWRNAGFNARAFDDINPLLWEKFLCNVTYSAPCTVFNCNVRELMADPHRWNIARTCGLEAYAAGRAKNIAFTFDDAERYVTQFGEKMPEARPSMLQDHRNRRRSEIDAINGMVPIVAARVGTRAPYNEVMSEIVRSRERSF